MAAKCCLQSEQQVTYNGTGEGRESPSTSGQAAHSCFFGDSCADMNADHCLPPEQQEIFDSSREVKSPPIAEIRAAESAAYRLDEDRRLAEALQHLQTSTGQEPAVGDASDVEAVAQGALPFAQLILAKDPHGVKNDIDDVSDVAICEDPAVQIMMHCLS